MVVAAGMEVGAAAGAGAGAVATAAGGAATAVLAAGAGAEAAVGADVFTCAWITWSSKGGTWSNSARNTPGDSEWLSS